MEKLITQFIVMSSVLFGMLIGPQSVAQAAIQDVSSVQQTITGTTVTMQEDIRAEIDQLVAGDRLRISIYLWTNSATKNSVLGALDKGVEVDIISEEDRWREYPSIRKNLIELRNAGATVKHCFSGCRTDEGERGLNHDKLIWIKKADGYEWATVSSMNFTYQDLYESGLRFDLTHYTKVRQFLEDRWTASFCQAKPIPATADITNIDNPFFRAQCPVFDPDYASAYQGQAGIFQPGGDYIHYAAWISDMGKLENEPCSLEVVMGHFDDSAQMMTVISELRQLQARGCEVDVIYGGDFSQVVMDAANAKSAGAEENIEIEHQGNVHAKQLTFTGKWKDENVQSFRTWAGSVNFTDNTMIWNDELGARSTHEAAYQQLREHFDVIERSEIGTHK